MDDRQYYIYIMTNVKGNVLYTGVTSDLARRVYEHKAGLCPGFTKRYRITKLVYYETCDDVMGAITREKQIKGGSRADKLALIDGFNKKRLDLSFRL